MAKIYITYRKYDTSRQEIDKLANHLRRAFGDAIVMISSAGDDDVVSITRKVKAVDAVLLVIGERWLDMVDERGKRLIDNRLDPHYTELVTALEDETKWVSTILIDGAKMPTLEQLPRDLHPLTERDVIDLSKPKHVADQIDTLRRRLIAEGIIDKPQINFPQSRKPQNDYPVPRKERAAQMTTDDAGNEVKLTSDKIPEIQVLNKVMIYSLGVILVIAALLTPFLLLAPHNEVETPIVATEIPTEVPAIVIDTERVDSAIARAALTVEPLPTAIPLADLSLLAVQSNTLEPITVNNLADLQLLQIEADIRGTQVIFVPNRPQLITSIGSDINRYEIGDLTTIFTDNTTFDTYRIRSIDFDETGDYVAVVTTDGLTNELNVVALEDNLNIVGNNRNEDNLYDAAMADNRTYGTNGFNYRAEFIAKSRRGTLPEGIVGAYVMDFLGGDFLHHYAIITDAGQVFLDGESQPRYDGEAVEPAYLPANDALVIIYNGALGLDSNRSDTNPFNSLIYYGEEITHVAAHPTAPILAVALNGDTLNLRDVNADTDSVSLQFETTITDITFNPDGTMMAVATTTGEVYLFGVSGS